MTAMESPCFDRIKLGGPWKCTEHCHNGAKGVLAFRGDLPPEIGPGKTCSDGLVYFSKELPTQEDLAKEIVTPRFPITLASGRVIDIPMCIYAPRILAFDCMEDGEHATEFGREGYRIWQMIEAKTYPKDAEVKRLIFLAIQHCYAVTEELLSNLGWVTDADVVPICLAVSGRNPKSAAVAGVTSPLSAAAS